MLDYKDVPDAVRDWIGRIGEANLNIQQELPDIKTVGRPSTYDRWCASGSETYRVLLVSDMPRAEPFADSV